MNIAEIITVATGVSLDICAVTICNGALLVRISKRKLAFLAGLIAVWQEIALMLGHLVTVAAHGEISLGPMPVIFKMTAAVIFFALGLYMFLKAWKNDFINEHRQEEINVRHAFILNLAVSVDAFFAGIGLGFLNTTVCIEAIVVFIVTLLAVGAGYYIGYMLGFEQKRKAYLLGGILLAISGIEILVKYKIS